MMKRLILFYPTGIVHFRNLELLKKNLPGFRFRVIVESWVEEKAPEVLSNIKPVDRVTIEDNRLLQEAWETIDAHIDILFLSMAYPTSFRLHLVYEAVKRNIPVIAIEEVNQLALNNGIINHYFLPLDYLGVPSIIEKDLFVELGIPEDKIMITGWPFFDYNEALKDHRYFDIRKKYNLQPGKKSCLLVLGSLKECDRVSLESRAVRQEILDIVSRGLPSEGYQLLIKPHPTETETELQEIQKQVPDAVLLNPKHPIEPLLAQTDLVVNRGNSQVTLLAMMRNKPLIVVPAGLKTIFHGLLDTIISNSSSEFRRILVDHSRGEKKDYEKILTNHFPISQKQAVHEVKRLFGAALKKKITDTRNKKIYISLLYAFLGDILTAKKVIAEIAGEETTSTSLLEKLYNHKITPGEFGKLLNYFPAKMVRWHLQALYIRVLIKAKNKKQLPGAVSLLEGFDGEVNPHYFIEELVKRIELEYQAGNNRKAEELVKKFHPGYSVFDYYRQAFDMLRFVYQSQGKRPGFRKILWLLKNLNTPYAREFIKDKFKR
jgi:hypothetical protein